MTPKEVLNTLDKTVIRNLELKIVLSEAIKKQIPQKITEPVCPSCNRIFLFRHGERKKGNYCDNCGQAIDWSGEE